MKNKKSLKSFEELHVVFEYKKEQDFLEEFKNMTNEEKRSWLEKRKIVVSRDKKYSFCIKNGRIILNSYINPLTSEKLSFDRKRIPQLTDEKAKELNSIKGRIALMAEWDDPNDAFVLIPKAFIKRKVVQKVVQKKSSSKKLDGLPVQSKYAAELERNQNIKKMHLENQIKKQKKDENIKKGLSVFQNMLEHEKIYFDDFVVMRRPVSCINKGHDIEDITAGIFVLDRNGQLGLIRKSASYCRSCDKYFIDRWQFDELRNYGIPLCQIINEYVHSTDNYTGDYFDSLNAESILKQAGYNVNSEDNLSETQRRYVLSFLVESGICTKSKIIAHLTWLIDSRCGSSAMANAVDKWKKDRDYIRNYRLGDNRIAYIGIIKSKRYI